MTTDVLTKLGVEIRDRGKLPAPRKAGGGSRLHPLTQYLLKYDPDGQGLVVPASSGNGQVVKRLTQHIPDHGAHLSRRFGFYSNKARGMRAKQAGEREGQRPVDEWHPPGLRERRRRWARLIKRVYEVDPLRCPKCGRDSTGSGGRDAPRGTSRAAVTSSSSNVSMRRSRS